MSEPKYPALFGRTETSPSGCIGSSSSAPVRTVRLRQQGMKGDNARFLGSSPKKRWVIVVLPTMTTLYTEDAVIRRCSRRLRIDCVIAASVKDRSVSRLSNRSAIEATLLSTSAPRAR